ncbi:MAG: glycosyltransferase family 2 protein [Candidatus Micrarchaeia archaeon]
MEAEKDRAFRLLVVLLLNIISIATVLFAAYLLITARTAYNYAISIAFAILVFIASFFNVYSSIWYYKSYKYESQWERDRKKLGKLKSFPTVAVAMPVFNEDSEVVGKNAKALTQMNYPKDRIKFYMLDDSTDKLKASKIREIAKRYNFVYIHRNNRKGYKAGALNNMLKYSKEEFVAVFDSDERLVNKNFLIDTLPYFKDKKVAYVQTEKRFEKGSFFSDAIDIFEAFFFKFIQSGRALNNTTIFAGSCGVLRRSVIDAVGGFPEYVLEDTFFSFEASIHGYKNIYVPKNYALGQPLVSFTALAKQQWRYNYGGTQFIDYYLRKDKSKLSLQAKIDYLLHGTGLDYVSVFLILFSIISIGIVFMVTPLPPITLANFESMLSNPLVMLEMMGIIAFAGSFMLPVILSGLYFGSYKKGFMVTFLNYALAVIRSKAAIAMLLHKEPGVQWSKAAQKSNGILYSIYAARTEIALASFIWVFAYIAINGSNLYGGIWLVGYGMLYALTALFLKVYG